MGHVANTQAQLFGIAWYLQTEYRNLAIARGQQAAQHADRSGFARAVGSKKAVNFALGYFEVQFINGDQIAKTLAQAMGLDGQFSHLPASPAQVRR